MKKKYAFLLAAVLSIGVMAGCGNQTDGKATTDSKTAAAADKETEKRQAEEETDEIMLRFAWWGNQTRNERTDQVLKAFSEQHPGVSFQEEANDYSAHFERLSAQVAGEDMPDLIQHDHRYIAQYIENDLLLDLTPYIENGTLDVSNITEEVLNMGKIDGKEGVYGICNGLTAPLMIYNKAITDAAGVEIKKGQEYTFDQFVEDAKTIYEKTGIPAYVDYGEMEWYVRAVGRPLYAADGKTIQPTEEDLVELLDIVVTGIKEGWIINPAVIAEINVHSTEENPIITGKVWNTSQFSNSYEAFKKIQPEGADFQITTRPSNDLKTANYLKPSQFWTVASTSKNPDMAVKVVDYLTNDIDCNKVLLGERGIPVSSVVSEAIKEDLTDAAKEVAEYIEYCKTCCSDTPAPDPTGAGEVKELWNQLFQEVSYMEKTPQEAAKEFVEQANEILKKAQAGTQ